MSTIRNELSVCVYLFFLGFSVFFLGFPESFFLELSSLVSPDRFVGRQAAKFTDSTPEKYRAFEGSKISKNFATNFGIF